MCLFTHFAAGALVGGVTGNPVAGALAGLASHAVLDAIPHYDHPDWRLELGGGAFGLFLLLMMPFASLPAILGGLCGMLPDLENLFQKLGKMRRDQFIFPTHTGLIPHGRTLGPRTLVWQAAIFLACFGLLGFLSPSDAAAAVPGQAVMGFPQVKILEAGQDLTRVRVDFPVTQSPADWQAVVGPAIQWALPEYVDEESGPEPVFMPPRFALSLAVPTTRPLKVAVTGVSWWRQPDGPVDDSSLAEFSVPAIFRSIPMAGGRVVLGAQNGILRSMVVEIAHPAEGQAAEQLRLARDYKAAGKVDRWSETAPAGSLNPELFQALARGGRELSLLQRPAKQAREKGLFNHFDLTDNWIRLRVDDTGVYRLTGQELANLGLALPQVDPTTLRLFQGGGLQLAQDTDLPEADQADRVGLTEVAIQVLDGGDDEWNLDDEIRFYGVGTSTWEDRFDPTATPLQHYDHPYENFGIYWLTWDTMASGPSPLPGVRPQFNDDLAPAVGGELVTTALLREHAEQQNVDAAGVVSDNWAWDVSVSTTRKGAFSLSRPVVDDPALFVIEFRPNPFARPSYTSTCTARGWLNTNGANAATTTFLMSGAEADSQRTRVIGYSSSLRAGTNEFTLENAGQDIQYLALDSFDILYTGELNTIGLGRQFDFTHWGTQVPSPGQTFDLQFLATRPADMLVWDVSDPKSPRALRGDVTGGASPSVTLGLTRNPSADFHGVAFYEEDLLSVVGASIVQPVTLRDQDSEVDYIVVYPADFAEAALELVAFHNQELPGIDNPVARAVKVEDIYDNYSGGRKDLLAIRNYLKSTFEDGNRLLYVCFLGNASRDFRNYKGHQGNADLVDIIPAQLRTSYPSWANSSYSYFPYASDDGLTSFDPPPTYIGLDVPDLASGRLPAISDHEALSMVREMIAFASEAPEGLWRNRVLMASDDCNRPGSSRPLYSETPHFLEAEALVNFWIPRTLDVLKIYGVDYTFPPGSGVKPQVRSDINAALNAGTTLYYYVGHGAEDNLADEQIFQSRDIANLSNGLKKPFFIAFSCDVGVYDNPLRRSMAETFVAATNGGAIGAICASQVSTIGANEDLSELFFANLFPGTQVVAGGTVSTALMLAKAQVGVGNQKNSQRYNLLGDPGLGLPNPLSDLALSSSSVDTLRAGARQVVVVDYPSGKSMLGAGDSYDVRVEESSYRQDYYVYYNTSGPGGTTFPYIKQGATVFRGTGVMGSDELRVPFKVPSQLRYGDMARVRLVIGGSDGEHAAERTISAIRSSTGPIDDVRGPAIALALPNRFRVQPGDPLTASLVDSSGIAILGTSPGNSILLEFDDTGFMAEVTEVFAFDPNSYTSGRLVFPLPGDIATGPHKAALHASDALGNVGNDTLSFTVGDYGVAGIRDMTLFPNPTAGECRLVFYLTDGMDVQWDIYTLSGRRLKTISDSFPSGGSCVLVWDGRDDQGDEIANGTYLFVLRGRWSGDKAREFKETGKLVIMR